MSTPPDSSPPPLRSSAEQPVGDPAASSHVSYVLALADDALITAQRMGWWISRAPQLEEDVAMANIGLDQLGQARALLSHAGALEGQGRAEDDLAYFRDERDFRNVHLVEREQDDFGVAMARLLIWSAYQAELYAALGGSADETLAAIAAKAVKEVAYHLDHASRWVERLGDGTEESHARMQAALEGEWPYLAELFEADWLDPALVEQGIAVDPTGLEQPVRATLARVLASATLEVPEVSPAVGGGRRGLHTEQMGYLLAEMQHLTRSHPGATW
jgi:ring-1,2-phenylacetyl-CoA epoxidase subunit PaaC